MVMVLEGQKYYSASEAAELAGVHRMTLLRWIRQGKIEDVQRDRNNWRIFSESDIDAIKHFCRFGELADLRQSQLPLYQENEK
jgi:excisionase family DNA binding protein